jgi:hypothetical protein
MDTPLCRESFEHSVDVQKDKIRITAYCMQFLKNTTIGIIKNENAGSEKEFDLDRKRDDESIIDVQSLKDPDYQISKKEITFYDTQDVDLLMEVEPTKFYQKWENQGELHLKISKSKNNRAKYWKNLEMSPNTV